MKKYKARTKIVIDGKLYDFKGDSTADLVEKIERKKAELRTVDNDTTVAQWSDFWLRTYCKNASLKTYKDIESRINNKILPVIGSMKLKDVKPSHCQSIMDSMDGYSMDRINKLNNTMYQMFRQAQARWYIDRNPAECLIKPEAEDGQGRALTPYERKILLKVCRYHEYGPWALTMLYCGLRPGETARVQWKHIRDRSIYIDGTKTANAKRTVPMPDKLYILLDKQRGPDNNYVFLRSGCKLNATSITRCWYNIRREMQIAAGTRVYRNELIEPYALDNDLIAYCLRHTFATDLKDSQMPYAIMQELLGHSTGGVTNTYLHGTKTSLEVAREYLEKYRHWRSKQLVSREMRWQHHKKSLKYQ